MRTLKIAMLFIVTTFLVSCSDTKESQVSSVMRPITVTTFSCIDDEKMFIERTIAVCQNVAPRGSARECEIKTLGAYCVSRSQIQWRDDNGICFSANDKNKPEPCIVYNSFVYVPRVNNEAK